MSTQMKIHLWSDSFIIVNESDEFNTKISIT